MSFREYTGPRLPHVLYDQIGAPAQRKRSAKFDRRKPGSRQDIRKVERKEQKPQPFRLVQRQKRAQASVSTKHVEAEEDSDSDADLNIEDAGDDSSDESEGPSPEPKGPSTKAKRKLEEDDAQIAALEKKLGIKTKKLPQSFQDDGLGDLLDGLDDTGATRSDDKDWLRLKRRRIEGTDVLESTSEEGTDQESDASDASDAQSSQGLGYGNDDDDDDEDEFDGLDSEVESEEESDSSDKIAISHSKPPQKQRENPYVAPGSVGASEKYIPRALRMKEIGDDDTSKQIRRQAQGLLNRLSEANMIALLGDVEKLYRDNARQYVTSTLISLLLDLLADPSTLSDTFVILHAGFIAAIYKITGADFAAQFIERFVERFDPFINATVNTEESGGKQAANLMALLAQLYNFQVVASTLVFDYLRGLLLDVSELRTELLLKITRLSGSQLRADDPSSLKDMVLLLQKTIAQASQDKLSVRTKFMVETINDLKNNKMKTGAAASALAAEHTSRMKKMLGTLNQRNSIKATEPLRISLADVRDSEKKGKWWLVGSSWKGPGVNEGISKTPSNGVKDDNILTSDDELNEDGSIDLETLARQYGMNTSIRRSIFLSIMSSDNYMDAWSKLMKLNLTKKQQTEIPRVLLVCTSLEGMYNPYYTLVSRKLCQMDRRYRMAFQFALWDVFRQMGESMDSGGMDDDVDENESQQSPSASRTSNAAIVSYAKLFADLLSAGVQRLSILKVLDLLQVKFKARLFVEVLLVTLIQDSYQRQTKKKSSTTSRESLDDIVSHAKETPELVTGLTFFIKRIVMNTVLVTNDKERNTVQEGCRSLLIALK